MELYKPDRTHVMGLIRNCGVSAESVSNVFSPRLKILQMDNQQPPSRSHSMISPLRNRLAYQTPSNRQQERTDSTPSKAAGPPLFRTSDNLNFRRSKTPSKKTRKSNIVSQAERQPLSPANRGRDWMTPSPQRRARTIVLDIMQKETAPVRRESAVIKEQTEFD